MVTFVLITVVVRALRDSAEAALAAARQGELTDPLTGLLNRRGFERSAGETWSRRAHDRKSVALIVLDIDHFKMVNDTLGHAAGDAVLRRLAALLRTALREEDVAVRLGGEEFAVLAAGEPGDGQRLAERLRQLVEAEMAPVTLSVGVVEPEPDPAPPREDQVAALWRAMERADTGLYEAKRCGRNRVVVMPG